MTCLTQFFFVVNLQQTFIENLTREAHPKNSSLPEIDFKSL
jgi:hypothetical protein